MSNDSFNPVSMCGYLAGREKFEKGLDLQLKWRFKNTDRSLDPGTEYLDLIVQLTLVNAVQSLHKSVLKEGKFTVPL